MSSRIVLEHISVKNPSAFFSEPIHIQVTLSALTTLEFATNWKVIYVGSAINDQYDQTLQQFQIEALPIGYSSKFSICCNAPSMKKIPSQQLLCLTALILTASYQQQEFLRVGYYVHNQAEEKGLNEGDLNGAKIRRTIISDKPRITKFDINWKKQTEKKDMKLMDYWKKYCKNGDESNSTNEKQSQKHSNSTVSISQDIQCL